MRLHIANGRLIDPAHGRDGQQDLFIAHGRVVASGQAPDGFQADQRIDAAGLAVLPGLVDLSARLLRQDAGAPADSRLSSAELRAALAGGVTTLAMPPDADAPLDEPAKIEALLREAPSGHGRVLPIGALTVGLRGETLAEMGLLAQAGCLAFSPGECGIADTRVLWGAMRYAAGLGLALWLRPQDPWLAQGAVVAAGAYADRLGLPGRRRRPRCWPCKRFSSCNAPRARVCICRACRPPAAWNCCAPRAAKDCRSARTFRPTACT